MKLDIRAMSQHEALVIAAWHYEPPYSFYDWTADADDLAELLGKGTREGKYFSALRADDELVGWFGFSCERCWVFAVENFRPCHERRYAPVPRNGAARLDQAVSREYPEESR